MKILVTGAAGYIGSVVTERLVEKGNEVLALDNLVNGHRAAVDPGAKFFQVDLLDAPALKKFFKENPVETVVHLAAEALVDVSLRDPGLFYRANMVGGINLLDAMAENKIKKIIFSSTAATYGEPKEIPITEGHEQTPVNTYGESKLAFEKALKWYRLAYGIDSVTFRYFNACGATQGHGEYHIPETHIIPVLFEVALGQRPQFSLYGDDYDTPDGSCVRDYVHVFDIAQAHLLALENISNLGFAQFNLGNNLGCTNKQVITAVEKVTGKTINTKVAPRRPGDPAKLVASSDKAKSVLGWQPQYPDLERIVETAWDWRLKHPKGY